jgi:transposase
METPRHDDDGDCARPGAGIEDPGRVSGTGTHRPDPEVLERARRRTFTAKYKLEILAAYDAAADGEKGALLRREGLYSSHIVDVAPGP